MVGAGRRHERRERRHGAEPVHYKMRQRLVSIGDDFWIEDAEGHRIARSTRTRTPS